MVGATVVGTDMEKLGATVGKEKLRLADMLAMPMDMLPSVRTP